jgi:putative transposase
MLHDHEPARSAGAPDHFAQTFVAHAPISAELGIPRELALAGSGKLYLAAILDLSSRFVVGWTVSAVTDRHLPLGSSMLLIRRGPPLGSCITRISAARTRATTTSRVLEACGIVGSMSHQVDCL